MIEHVNWDRVQGEAMREAQWRGLRDEDAYGFTTGRILGLLSNLCNDLIEASNRQEATLNAIRTALEHRAPSTPPPSHWNAEPTYPSDGRNNAEAAGS